MAIQNKTTLESYFETGDNPSESEFGDLIDSTAIIETSSGSSAISTGSGTIILDDNTINIKDDGVLDLNNFTLYIPGSGSVTLLGELIVANNLAKFTDGSTVGNSSISDNGLVINIVDGVNISTGTGSGLMIGTSGSSNGQKLGFFGGSPIVQPVLATSASATVDDIITVLQSLGLVRQS